MSNDLPHVNGVGRVPGSANGLSFSFDRELTRDDIATFYAVLRAAAWSMKLAAIEALRHDSMTFRAPKNEDPFIAWTATLPAKHWAKYDISACALGWNAAIDAVLNVAGPVPVSTEMPPPGE